MSGYTDRLSRRLRHPEPKQRPGKHRPDKGLFMGACNREACQRAGADHYNHSTRKYYCRECARLINAANRRDHFVTHTLGHDLCTLGQHVSDPA